MSNMALKKIYNAIPSLWNSNSDKLNDLANNKILNIGNALSGIFPNNESVNLETPQLVVIGSQSSGKSSVLNNIIQMDILPVGSNMVTRTPLNLQLMKSDDKPRVEFGMYLEGRWKCSNIINITLPKPSESEKELIRDEIEKLTIKIAGSEKNISSTPIIIKIFHPNIPNLSLIDLPGLTMVACTDQGQPKNIKKLIRNMLVEYIKKKRTLILCVMPARIDLEADNALDLVKEYDPKGERTIGILTKVDLMNENTDISRYIENNISKDLQLGYGYYAVKNRSPAEMKEIDIYEGLQKEKEFFSKHPVYSKSNRSKLGILNVTDKLSEILINHIKKSLPEILNEINLLYSDINKKYLRLGDAVPETNEGKTGLIHSILSDYCQEFIQSMDNKKDSYNYGKKFKDIFIDYRKRVDSINPFNKDQYTDEYINNSIDSCVGNHMSILTSPIEVLEHCLKDKNKKPFSVFINPSITCVFEISSCLHELNNKILIDKKYSRFPNLCLKIKEIVNNKIIKVNIQKTNNMINDIIKMEENYIWTDESLFLEEVKEIFSKKYNFSSPDNVRKLLESYFTCIKKNINNNIPKLTMMCLVKRTIDNLSSIVFEEILKNNILDLVQEKDNIKELREKYLLKLNKIKSVKKYIDYSL
jgi:vacuolar protein sorting-associated protein 1